MKFGRRITWMPEAAAPSSDLALLRRGRVHDAVFEEFQDTLYVGTCELVLL